METGVPGDENSFFVDAGEEAAGVIGVEGDAPYAGGGQTGVAGVKVRPLSSETRTPGPQPQTARRRGCRGS